MLATVSLGEVCGSRGPIEVLENCAIMAELTPDIASEVVAACQSGVEEAAAALGRTLDGEFELTVGNSSEFKLADPPDGFDGAGLAVSLTVGDACALVLLPASTGMVPDWCAEPDATGSSKLSTLAQELGMLLLPESHMPDASKAFYVDAIQAAIASAELAESADLVPIEIKSGDKSGQLSLVWPAANPDALIVSDSNTEQTAATAEPTSDFGQLPVYSRSLLKIEVPVTVCLATKRQSIAEIIEIGPGAMLNFDKSCDELLELQVNELSVANGEVVKVGEKFGLKINEFLLPQEHFAKVQRPAG